MTYSLVIYLLLGWTPQDVPVYDEQNPIVVKSGMLENDCTVGIEQIYDTNQFVLEREVRIASSTKGGSVTVHPFQPTEMAVFCEPQA